MKDKLEEIFELRESFMHLIREKYPDRAVGSLVGHLGYLTCPRALPMRRCPGGIPHFIFNPLSDPLSPLKCPWRYSRC